MIAQMKNWFEALSSREQWLVGIAGGLLALVVLVYGIAVPTYQAIDRAQTELAEATERRGRLEALAALAKAAPNSATGAAVVASGATLESMITEGATSGGFEISSGAAAGTDEYSFRLASTKAGPLLAWLTGLEAQGIMVSEIRLQQGEGGFVAADVRVRRRP
jgi:general secretion pathway protein M